MMMTVKQVSIRTGVSVRTLQFYDEIGLLKPTQVTNAGYRLYDTGALEALQQILFFKELDFTLKEIKAIMDNPDFDQVAAFQKQRELIQIKRDRLNSLLSLLDKLIKGEKTMDFHDFSMRDYFQALEDFKTSYADDIVRQLGSVEAFDEMLAGLKSNEAEIADMAVKQYGNIARFTQAMKDNFQQFLTHGPAISPCEVSGLMKQTEALTRRLTADLSKHAASDEIQDIVKQLIDFTNECNRGIDTGEHYWANMAENYITNPLLVEANDKKYGIGASQFIGQAIKVYLDRRGGQIG